MIIAQNDNSLCVLLEGGSIPDDIEGVYSSSVDEDFLATFEPVTFTIFFWGINNDDASNIPTINEATVQEAMTRINDDFNPFNIFFRLKGFDNQSFNSSAHHIGANLQEIGTYAKQNGLINPHSFNVYIPEDHGPGSGEARFNSTICAVQRSDFNDYTLTHELAHDFFILHTREFFNTTACEHVTRDPNDPNYNATTAGDRVADTAACPRYSGNPEIRETQLDEENCLYIGDLTDCEGTPYEIFQEDILNYMSAFAFSCRSIFSTGQKIRMHESIVADINNVFVKTRITRIPDPNFEQSLINQGIDSDGVLNGEVLTADIYTLTSLDISNKNIQDLTGIQDFTALQTLNCSFNNEITSIHLSKNQSLETLITDHTSLESLDISSNSQLRFLSVQDNNLTHIDVSNNVLLETLNIANLDTPVGNEITDLDLSTNTALTSLIASNVNLSSLNIQNGNTNNITTFSTLTNLNLNCIQVDNATRANNRETPYSQWEIDAQTFFSEDCSITDEGLFLSTFKIIPNPVQDIISIIPPQEIQLSKIEVYDITGKRVILQEVDLNNVSVSTLPKGVFFLRIDTQTNTIIKRFIKG